MDRDLALTQISKRIDNFARFHTLHAMERKPSDFVNSELDHFVCALPNAPDGITFTGIGKNWRELPLPDARYVLQYILSHDIAYQTPEVPEPDAA